MSHKLQIRSLQTRCAGRFVKVILKFKEKGQYLRERQLPYSAPYLQPQGPSKSVFLLGHSFELHTCYTCSPTYSSKTYMENSLKDCVDMQKGDDRPGWNSRKRCTFYRGNFNFIRMYFQVDNEDGNGEKTNKQRNRYTCHTRLA